MCHEIINYSTNNVYCTILTNLIHTIQKPFYRYETGRKRYYSFLYGKLEARDVDWKNGAALEKAGVPVGFHTDDPVTDSRLFLRSAAFAVRAGMSRAGALRALTLTGAEMLDLQDRVGSLEAGKDADFIVLSGDPLSVYTHVEQTWIEGKKVFDRADPQDRLWAVGGPGAGDPRRSFMCCYESAWDIISAANNQ